MNVELLRKVQERIKAEPHLFQMPKLFHETDCGTACCIWGWAMAIEGIASDNHEFYSRTTPTAERLFDISDDQVSPLIQSDEWPQPFWSEFIEAEEANDKIAQAEIACRRIDHFIKTGE